MTRQRALILEILQHSPKHLTADEIFAIAREKMPIHYICPECREKQAEL